MSFSAFSWFQTTVFRSGVTQAPPHNLTGTWFTRVLAPFNYALATMLLPDRLVESFGMRRSAPVRMTFHAIVWITRLLVWLLPLGFWLADESYLVVIKQTRPPNEACCATARYAVTVAAASAADPARGAGSRRPQPSAAANTRDRGKAR